MNIVPTNQTTAELAVASSAAQAKALVEAKYTIAMHRPRDIMQVRDRILAACKRPMFAERVQYRKPVGNGNFISGPSIRFAEECIRAMTNIDVQSTVIYEDAEKMVVRITAIDLETNTSYGDDVIIGKTVERSQPKDREVIATRTNSRNQTVYIVACTADELTIKMAAAKSKVVRNNGLRLVPSDIVEEAVDLAKHTMEHGGQDREARAKKTADAFSEIGVKPSDLKAFLGVEITAASPRQLSELREIYAAIRDGDTTWKAVMEAAKPEAATSAAKPAPVPVDMPPAPAPQPSAVKESSTTAAPAVTESEPEPAPAAAEVPPAPKRKSDRELLLEAKAIIQSHGFQPADVAPVLRERGIWTEEMKWGGLDREALIVTLAALPEVCEAMKTKPQEGGEW